MCVYIRACLHAHMCVCMCIVVCNKYCSNIIYNFCWSADTNCGGGGSGTDEPQHPKQVASTSRIASDQRPGNTGTSDKERFSHVDDKELGRLLK